jgi:nanoRNase/pAp phosphatase (c-di-AMP/oligoRNAs hydrolase)
LRLITRGNLDGLVSAVLISTVEDVKTVKLVHPKDISDNKVHITDTDIIANLPYHPDCGIWFDHHQMRENDQRPSESFKGEHKIAPSVARVIYEYYSSDKLKPFEYLLDDTDRFDSAQLSMEDITDPQGIILLGFTIDSRSGIGHFKDYFNSLVVWLQIMNIDEILQQPEVVERENLLRENNSNFLQVLKESSYLDGNVVITDFRSLENVPIGNRFLVYTLFPEANVSVRLQWGPDKAFVAATLGHSIFNRTSKSDCGDICNKYGGGGHAGAAGCPIATEKADQLTSEIVQALKEAG